ncbi:MAG TPA: transcriptional regulator [Eubacteriaceae bacterium]|nr:transcriptional regulator [Eubacteriaceae bacterium]
MHSNTPDYLLNIIITRNGLGSKVLSIARSAGLTGGTVLMGKGRTKSSILKFLELAENTREIVLIVSNTKNSRLLLESVSKKFHFRKPHQGIAFSLSILDVYGTQSIKKEAIEPRKGANPMKEYHSIFVIVDRGGAETVVDAATKAGAKGATIINARGSGIHETKKIFSIEIEPEKEIVLILVEEEISRQVCDGIKEATELDQPGRGILFVQNVVDTYGVL